MLQTVVATARCARALDRRAAKRSCAQHRSDGSWLSVCPNILVAMPPRRSIALNLLRLAVILAGAALVTLWRLLMPAADQRLEVSQHSIAKLSELRVRTKYVDMPGTIYNGRHYGDTLPIFPIPNSVRAKWTWFGRQAIGPHVDRGPHITCDPPDASNIPIKFLGDAFSQHASNRQRIRRP
jgi:hypothetical protein